MKIWVDADALGGKEILFRAAERTRKVPKRLCKQFGQIPDKTFKILGTEPFDEKEFKLFFNSIECVTVFSKHTI